MNNNKNEMLETFQDFAISKEVYEVLKMFLNSKKTYSGEGTPIKLFRPDYMDMFGIPVIIEEKGKYYERTRSKAKNGNSKRSN